MCASLGAVLKIIASSHFTVWELCFFGLFFFFFFMWGTLSNKINKLSLKIQFHSILGSSLPLLSWFYLVLVGSRIRFGSQSRWEQWLLIHPSESSMEMLLLRLRLQRRRPCLLLQPCTSIAHQQHVPPAVCSHQFIPTQIHAKFAGVLGKARQWGVKRLTLCCLYVTWGQLL